MKYAAPRPIQLVDYKPSTYLIDKVDLDVVLDATATRVTSKLKIRRNPEVTSKAIALKLDGENLLLKSLSLNGKTLEKNEYRVTKSFLTIAKPPQQPFTLTIETEINPDANKALQGLYRSRGLYCTQCEAEGFRRITYFLDRPDILAVYKVRIEADANEAPVLLSNGNLLERGTLAGGKRHYAVWHDPHPKPCYLFAFVGGNLSSIASNFTTASGRHVELGIYVESGKENRAGWAMECLKRAMRWDEVRFGREYDLDVFNIVAVSDFNMGAMENKGLNIFNDRLILASEKTATDSMFESIETVVAHEYFHNWTGNRITCRDWFQLCLKEGLTVYRDQEFTADERSAVVKRIADVRRLRTHQFSEDQGPLAHAVRPESYIEINNFYTATVYEKGAELVRMIERILGRQKFRKGMDFYFERHDGEAATIEDFLTSFEDACGCDLKQFKRWYAQAGTPQVTCTVRHNRSNATTTLKLEQFQPDTPGQTKKRPLCIPIEMGLLDRKGNDIPLNTTNNADLNNNIVLLTKPEQSFKFRNTPERPVPSLLRRFSAPVDLTIKLSEPDLKHLIAHDTDGFNRWQAANTYATRTIIQLVQAKRKGKRSYRGKAYAKALQNVISDRALEPALRAELLKLPSPADIAREIGKNINHDHICASHRQLARLLAKTLGDELEEICEDHAQNGPFSADASAMGKRALHNAALALLTHRGKPGDLDRTAEHFYQAHNMTDQAHALFLLSQYENRHRADALASFYDQWHNDHIVMDTWFAAQAQFVADRAVEEIRTLTAHKAFDLTTPNKVRALIGTFTHLNPQQFNRADGAGYRFLADQVLQIDQFNPQIAARLLSSLRSWRALESRRKKKAHQELSRIANSPGLSKDVYEIVSKTLDV